MSMYKTILSNLYLRKAVHPVFCFACLLIILCLNGCNKPSSSTTGSLTGTVTLLNDSGEPTNEPVDYSEITVALYELAKLDTTLVRINRESPNIGIKINQDTEFDHRLQNPVAITQTDGIGRFTFSKINTGRYNLIYYKEGWGIRYIYNITVEQGENTLYGRKTTRKDRSDTPNPKQNESLVLYPQTVLPQTVSDEFICKEDHTYYSSNDVLFLDNLYIEAGANILMGAGCKISVVGTLQTSSSGQRWKIASINGYLGTALTTVNSNERFARFSLLQGSESQIQNGVIKNMQDGLVINGSNCRIDNMLFRDCGTAVLLLGNDLTYINNIIQNCDDRAHYMMGSATIQRNIILNNYDAFVLQDDVFDFNNNCLLDNWVGIRPIYGTTHIHHNAFDRNTYAISTMASDPLIEYNNFYGSTRYCIQTQANYVQAYFDYSNPILHFNNFYAQRQIAISLQPDSHPGYYASNTVGVLNDIDATNNYWKTANVSEVLFDTEDSDKVQYSIIYNPKRASPVSGAGIQN